MVEVDFGADGEYARLTRLLPPRRQRRPVLRRGDGVREVVGIGFRVAVVDDDGGGGLKLLPPPRLQQSPERQYGDDVRVVVVMVVVVEGGFRVDDEDDLQVLVRQRWRDRRREHRNVVQVGVVVGLGTLFLLVQLESRLFERLAAIPTVRAEWD